MKPWDSIECDRIDLAVGDFLARMHTMDPRQADFEPDSTPLSLRMQATIGLVLGVALGSAAYIAVATAFIR